MLLPHGLAATNARFAQLPQQPEGAHLPLTFTEAQRQHIISMRGK